MNNTVKCPRCKKQLIVEEYREHSCLIRFTDVMTIGIVEDYGTVEDQNGDLVHLIKTVKGQILRLVKCDHPIPHNLPDQARSDASFRSDRPDGDSPEPARNKTQGA